MPETLVKECGATERVRLCAPISMRVLRAHTRELYWIAAWREAKNYLVFLKTKRSCHACVYRRSNHPFRWNGYRDRSPLTLPPVDPQMASMQFDKMPGYRQAKSRAVVISGKGAFFLTERF
jgi:hypothetical protein